MKHILFISALLLLLTACGGRMGGNGTGTDSAAVAQIGSREVYVPQRADFSFRTEVRTINEDNEVRWDTIVVYLTDAKDHTQELYIHAQPLDTVNWSKGSMGEVLQDDWNFDGFADLQVCTGPMNGFGNYTYDVWLWNEKAHRFEYLDYKCDIYSPTVDYENKRIVSVWRLDDDVEIIRYAWKDGKLVEVEREQMSQSELTSEDMEGIYDSLDDNMKSVNRFRLYKDGTATWNVIGSPNFTAYTYTISGNTICLKPNDVDSEEDCYEYDEDTRTLKNEQGAVYYRQIAE